MGDFASLLFWDKWHWMTGRKLTLGSPQNVTNVPTWLIWKSENQWQCKGKKGTLCVHVGSQHTTHTKLFVSIEKYIILLNKPVPTQVSPEKRPQPSRQRGLMSIFQTLATKLDIVRINGSSATFSKNTSLSCVSYAVSREFFVLQICVLFSQKLCFCIC